jgi:hypothetical protein
MKPTLVILAAGIGSRYGGLKQLESVGPSGETIMDYSIYDALRAGFGKAVFVIRPDMEVAFRETIGRRYEQRLAVAYAFQRLDALPPGFSVPTGRAKPWGTGHAVLSAAQEVHEPFAVVNADDFYGANSFAALARFLQQEDRVDKLPIYAVVGFTLRDTLSDVGAVNRGCCRCTSDGYLESIVEVVGIERHGTDGRYADQSGHALVISGDEPVSMNTWGFYPVVFDQLRERFERFLNAHAGSPNAEFHLPTGVQELLRAGCARVKLLPTADRWFGVTHPQDRPRVVRMIGELVEGGEYPGRLWD